MIAASQRLWYRYWPGTALGELLKKQWMETAVPVVILIVVVAYFSSQIDGFFAASSLSTILRIGSEIGLVVLGETLVLIGGGIDLSVGGIYALTNLLALYLVHVTGMAVIPAALLTVLAGAVLGGVNGFIVGYLKLRAFLATIVTMIVYLAVFTMVQFHFAVSIASTPSTSNVWDYLGTGNLLNVPFELWIFGVILILYHVHLTRARGGWHLTAVGGNRRAAFNTGLRMNRVIAESYVIAGALYALAAILYGARIDSSSADTGSSLILIALAGALVGGNRLGGGKGSASKAAIGTLIVVVISISLRNLSYGAFVQRIVLAAVLLAATTLDMRWFKNRGKMIQEVYVTPGYLELPQPPKTNEDSIYALNDKLDNIELIGVGQIEAPEDVILDKDDNLYCGERRGDVIKFLAPDYKRHEVYAHVGGQPLGMAFDAAGNLNICDGGMGLYRITPDRKVQKVTDETNRSLLSIIDDSRLRLADDLDIAPDGRIFFSEATVRFEMHEWQIDSVEGRPNGRIICYDPNTGKTHTAIKNLVFPNGVCVSWDGQSILFAESWAARVSRYWISGPDKGKVERVIEGLPGYPDNINLASDGNYWLALMGMRCPALDLAMRRPGFRKRMVKRLPDDEWIAPNINVGCIAKFNDRGEIVDVLWERKGINHPMITSMREHRGYLYIGGITNNRIGRYKLGDGSDPNFVQHLAKRSRADA
ncbi:MAG: ABC transporter permease [Bradyrhizobium sp.]